MNSQDIIETFNECFFISHKTILKGGYTEPEYIPIQDNNPAEIHFKENYSNSALHEIAHWCIAGKERRQEIDFGYWYSPDGRSDEEQLLFYEVEVKPQSLEWAFCLASGMEFHISCDNLGGGQQNTTSFQNKVEQQLISYLKTNLPTRAASFFEALYLKKNRTPFRKNQYSKLINQLNLSKC